MAQPSLTAIDSPTPQQRLAQTRSAIEQQMAAGRPAPASNRPAVGLTGGASAVAPTATKVLWLAAQAWWRKQPASVAVDLAEPILGIYARRYPLWVVAAAASLGAATTLARPWRLLSSKRLMWLAASSAGVPALMQSWSTQRKSGVR